MLRTQVIGHGTEAIVCLHGWSSVFDSAPEFTAALGRRYTLILVYLPGYAGEPDDPRTESLDWLLGEIAAAIEPLVFTRFHLLGHSMGAQIAVQLAQRYPEKVEKLILIGVRPPERRRELTGWWLKVPGFVRLIRSIPWLEHRIVNRAFAYALQLTPGNQPKPFRPVNVSVHGAFDTLVAHLRRYADPFQAKRPALYIYGDQDRMRPQIWPAGKELYLVPGAGHWVFAAEPTALADRIRDFLEQ
jgi:pimeloyl-ACP methyl ester carboxylesterase